MDVAAYFRSIKLEMDALKGRVRQMIDDRHWLTDGEWKETVLRTVLKRHMPSNVSIGRGFIVEIRRQSTQIDVILYDNTKPLLHQDGDLVFVTPDAVLGIIEVKAALRRAGLSKTLDKISDNAEMLTNKDAFVGLFAFDHNLGPQWCRVMGDALQSAAKGNRRRAVNHVCIGPDHFIKFWRSNPRARSPKWSLYQIRDLAAGYFVANAIECLAPESVQKNPLAWFPSRSKEVHKIHEQSL